MAPCAFLRPKGHLRSNIYMHFEGKLAMAFSSHYSLMLFFFFKLNNKTSLFAKKQQFDVEP